LSLSKEKEFFAPAGCTSCNQTGYRGRTAVYELFRNHNVLSDLVIKGVTASQLRNEAQRYGMKSLREAALVKLNCGETSVSEVLRETAL